MKFDYCLALDAIRDDLKEGITADDFALQLKMLMTNFGDGHSRVSIRDVIDMKTLKWLPFTIIKHSNKFYAVHPGKKEFYDPKFPMITHVNGISIEQLYQSAERFISKTTPKFVERNATEYLFYIELLLEMNSIKSNGSFDITFSNNSETSIKSMESNRYPLPPLRTRHLYKDSILSKWIRLSGHPG